MRITQLAIENNRVTLLLLAVIILSGLQSYLNMPRAYDPGFIIRTAQVITYFPGASPQRVEQLISAPLEDVVKEIAELDFVKSESRSGISIVTVNIKESYKQMRPIWDNLRRKMEDVANDLPEGVLGPYVNDEFGDVYGVVLTLSGEGFDYTTIKNTADQIKDELQRLADVAKIDILGEQDERIFVEYDNARLSELGLSPYQLSQSLETRNIVIAGGTITLGTERIQLEPSGNFESIEDIEHTIIKLPDSNRVIYLKDIATISRGYIDPPSTLVHSSGTRALGIAISMREGGNNIRLGEQVQEKLKQFELTYPYGLDLDVVNFSPAEVDNKVRGFVSNLLQAIAVVTLVMLFSLGLRTGLIVSVLIPTAMLFSLSVMLWFNIGLDQISLAALIIALGMLVDNGIVMSENILVEMESGKSATQAAIQSASELQIPLLTASLTTAAAFLPIYLAESNIGEFTASLFKVVTITLLCSWILSLTIIPLLCTMFLKVKARQGQNPDNEYHGPLYQKYRQGLLFLLQRPAKTLLLTIALFICAMSLFSFIPNIFFPPSDRNYFKMELELPIGTSIETTEDVVSAIESHINDKLIVNEQRSEGVINWVSYIGNAGPRFILSHNPKPSSANTALFIINTTSTEIIDSLMSNLAGYSFQHFPDLVAKIKRIENGPAIENPVEVRLSGDNVDVLFANVTALKKQLAKLGTVININDDWGQRIKKLNVNINQARALRAGVTSQDIAISLQSGISGLQLTEYREGEQVIPVILRTHYANRQDIGKVESLSVYAQASGKSVPLKQVADIEVVWEAAKIMRRNGSKTVTVGAQLQPGITANTVFNQITPWLETQQQNWDIGYRYELGGEAETSSKANKSITDKLPVAAFIILILLVSQFNSIRKSVIILATIPLGLIGVILGLLVGQSFFGFMTFLGIISLAGIVINNAIVLLERIKIELDNGLEQHEAIIIAAQKRMRPILLTTATTVLGLIPLYLGGGEMWEPMAIAIMAGLLFSTLLTLGFVPVLYSLLYRNNT